MNASVTLAAALLATGLAAGAASAQSYPRLIGGADNSTVEYAPGSMNNVVGGGPVTVITEEQGKPVARHAPSSSVQRPLAGLVPVLVGPESSYDIVWVPSTPSSTMTASTPSAPRG
ncbi:hypothetical protein [Roseococcus pinisoli]|uniref:Uncharacterized protein n=1 Tax=Roseococcus pinisoli TaxID=2835040 RepID=A0ABS5QB83_9PROT|nr:hypothetical protein [Roseococcus pinisoli]MBS7810215.1 hypothetical protein [Roseococcus pinisoli]